MTTTTPTAQTSTSPTAQASTSQVPALACTNVSKRYDTFQALNNINLEIQPGEIFALLGPNGAGKTTLIHCIAGLSRATSGSIAVFGHDVVKDFRVTRPSVGLVPQEIAFDPFFTPIESLMIQMGLMGTQPNLARAEELLKKFHLWDHRAGYTRTLSGGMKRRLLIAKALAHNPKLLFLDEPTAGVDVTLRQELWTEVERLRQDGMTIVLTTHYIEEAEQLADRIGILYRGHLLLTEPKDTLLARHQGKSLETIFVEITQEAEAKHIAAQTAQEAL